MSVNNALVVPNFNTPEKSRMTISAGPELQLVALMCSRLCHDLVGPVGAVSNGAELLDEDDPGLVKDAHALIATSAGQAIRRLKFFRLAFGAAANVKIDPTMAREVAEPLLQDGHIALKWDCSPEGVDAAHLGLFMRLALNLMLIAQGALPRGGTLRVEFEGASDRPALILRGEGPMASINESALAALRSGCQGQSEAVQDIDARAVQPFFAGRLAERLQIDITVPVNGPKKFEVRAEAPS